MIHVLKDCPLVSMMELHIIHFNERSNFFGTFVVDWIHLNLHHDLGSAKDVKWVET